MTVCSLNKKDIDFHYRRMSFRYHALGGVNDETLRQVYLNSLPSELQGELQRLIEFSGKSLREITLGEIHMFTHTALEKLCATQRIFSKMLKEGKKYSKHCKFPPDYHLKCKSGEHCNCRANTPNRDRPRKMRNQRRFSGSRKYKQQKFAASGYLADPTTSAHLLSYSGPPISVTSGTLLLTMKAYIAPTYRSPYSTSSVISTTTTQMSSSYYLTSQGTPPEVSIPSHSLSYKIPKTPRTNGVTHGLVQSVEPKILTTSTIPLAISAVLSFATSLSVGHLVGR
ncbi:hypothetical protein Ddye_014171 [Dipteronia dyeriana]|uniref:Uncharacterized protein n=1 Tax=Dipteronia dyeriana TaxID=168575 RepID=A0AAD9X7J7_9ROSI|nr:hypothetical protein Ddye_014171 [Dipteronia dyeriana]